MNRYLRYIPISIGALAVSSPAHADEPASFPVMYTERPIMLYDGMTEVAVDLDLPTYTISSTDAAGNATTRTTRIGEYVDLDPRIRHAFGPVEIGAGIGFNLAHPLDHYYPGSITGYSVAGRFAVGIGDISVGLGAHPTFNSADHSDHASIGYELKWHAVPELFALYAGAWLAMDDYSFTSSAGPPTADRVESGSLQVDCELHALQKLTADLYGDIVAPLASLSGMTGRTYTQLSLAAIYEGGGYDLVANFGVGDLTHNASIGAAIGVRFRFGPRSAPRTPR